MKNVKKIFGNDKLRTRKSSPSPAREQTLLRKLPIFSVIHGCLEYSKSKRE